MRTTPIPLTFDPTSELKGFNLVAKKDGVDSSGYPRYVFSGEYDDLIAFMTGVLSMSSAEADIEIGDEEDFDHNEDYFRDAQQDWDEIKGSSARTMKEARSIVPHEPLSPEQAQRLQHNIRTVDDILDRLTPGQRAWLDSLDYPGTLQALYGVARGEVKEEQFDVDDRDDIDAAAARRAGSGRPFEGLSLKAALLEARSPVQHEPISAIEAQRLSQNIRTVDDILYRLTPGQKAWLDSLDGYPGTLQALYGVAAGDVEEQSGQPCDHCGSENTTPNESMPSMMGYGHDESWKCNDCGKTSFNTPLGESKEHNDVCPMCHEVHTDQTTCDYEECGHCGFDHSYEPNDAARWHQQNDPQNKFYESRLTKGKSPTTVAVGDKVDVWTSFLGEVPVRVIELVDDVWDATGISDLAADDGVDGMPFEGPGFVGEIDPESGEDGQLVFSLHQIVPGSKEEYAAMMDDDPYMNQKNYDREDYNDPATMSDYFDDNDKKASVPWRANPFSRFEGKRRSKLVEASSVGKESLNFDRFMDRIVVQESQKANRKLDVVADSPQRQRAQRYQDRPANKTKWSR